MHDDQTDATFLVTGGCGFIGAHLAAYLLTTYPRCRVVVVDAMTPSAADGFRLKRLVDAPMSSPLSADSLSDGKLAGNVERLTLAGTRCFLFPLRLETQRDRLQRILEAFQPRAVFHLAAETHVDRSLEPGSDFAVANVVGTQILLEAVLETGCLRRIGFRFVYVSTDEVYGCQEERKCDAIEKSPTAPSNPYAATKLGAEALTQAYCRSFGLSAVITRGVNTHGPWQFPEKFIPRAAWHALHDKPIPLYGDGQQVREWLHVGDHVRAIDLVRCRGGDGEVYNVGSDRLCTNKWLAGKILDQFGKLPTAITYVPDRPGHDRRYGVNSLKLARLGFVWDRFDSLADTIEWYGSAAGAEWFAHAGKFHDADKRQGLR